MKNTFELPPVIKELASARKRLEDHFAGYGLPFRFDGNLVGNLGEALAVGLCEIRPKRAVAQAEACTWVRPTLS